MLTSWLARKLTKLCLCVMFYLTNNRLSTPNRGTEGLVCIFLNLSFQAGMLIPSFSALQWTRRAWMNLVLQTQTHIWKQKMNLRTNTAVRHFQLYPKMAPNLTLQSRMPQKRATGPITPKHCWARERSADPKSWLKAFYGFERHNSLILSWFRMMFCS